MRFLSKKAFTLAETLVVIGIIGIVAALTVPNLTQSTNDVETVAKVKKVYANLNDALGRAVSQYGPVTEWFADDTTSSAYSIRFANRMKKFMKISTDCGVTNVNCFKPTLNTLDASVYNYQLNTTYYEVITADGTSLAMVYIDNICNTSSRAHAGASVLNPNLNICGFIVTDIDGPAKGSSIWGKDLFGFYITKKMITPWGGKNECLDADLTPKCFKTGVDCAGWVIENGNADYLKATRAGVCPNGQTLSWSNITCK